MLRMLSLGAGHAAAALEVICDLSCFKKALKYLVNLVNSCGIL